MAFTPIASVTAGPGAGGGATSAIDTTGANLLVVSGSYYPGGGGTLTFTDNKGNTWVPLTLRAAGAAAAHQFAYAKNAIVGTGHTFSVTGTNIYIAIIAHAFAGAHTTAPFDVQSGAISGTPPPLATGSITPSQNGALIVTGFCGDNVSSLTVSGGFTQTTRAYSSGFNMAGATGYQVQATAAAINPSWSWSGALGAAVNVASFLPAAAAAVARAETFIWMP